MQHAPRRLVPRAAPAPGVQLLPELALSHELEEAEASEAGWSEAGWSDAACDERGEPEDAAALAEAAAEAQLVGEVEAQARAAGPPGRRTGPHTPSFGGVATARGRAAG
jgi:hypothetical protein